MSILYPKIDTLFVRDINTFKVNTNQIRNPEWELINKWHLTEKVDGTNIRIVVDKNSCTIGGRTDKAQIYGKLATAMEPMLERARAWYENHFTPEDDALAVIFGEGYGAKIQSGGGYRDDQSFRIFDVWIGDSSEQGKFLDWNNVVSVCQEVDIPSVPVLGQLTDLALAEDVVKTLATSIVADEDGGHGVIPEGIVARTDPYLYTWKGHRVMWKLKGKDF